MAGLEIAGLVVGIFPVAINAVQNYREALRPLSLENLKRDLDYMERDLKTEQLRLQNTCETLLHGIAPSFKVDSLITDPFGSEWTVYADKLRRRLYTAYDVFEEHTKDMSTEMQKLSLQLGIEEGSQIDSRDRKSILQALKRNASFTLKRNEYKEILSRIKSINNDIENLSKGSLELEAPRRQRFQSIVTSRLREVFQSIYDALRSAITCNCVYPHGIGLQISDMDIVMLPGDNEGAVARKLEFPVTFKVADKSSNIQMMHRSEEHLTSQWKTFRLKRADNDEGALNPAPLSPSSVPFPPKRRVRWDLLGKTQTVTSLQTTTMSTETSPAMVSNLCEFIQRRLQITAMDYLGYVMDTRRKFMLSPLGDADKLHGYITLRQVINNSFPELALSGFKGRFQLALSLSISFLHLNGTSWLARTVTLDDIVFMVEIEPAKRQSSGVLDRPFVIKAVHNTPAPQVVPPQTAPSSTSSSTWELGSLMSTNLSLLSLGALLIQIMFGRAEEELSMLDITDPSSIDLMVATGKQRAEIIKQQNGL
ncbi:hypothetical protein GGR51DRAFT_532330 [Nemania sp. FL0031]|nr:hypothetical protein GGR51DRAFT_532330 [Nemania sp. FL0031]